MALTSVTLISVAPISMALILVTLISVTLISVTLDFSNAYLGNANLSNADFRGANLGDSDLISGGQRLDGYEFYGQIKDGELWIKAGCRYFSIDEARRHWNETRKDTTLGDETFLRLDMIESIAKTRFGEF